MLGIDKLIDTEYEAIKNDAYESVIEQMLAEAEFCDTPTITQVSGMPGAGKSSFCKEKRNASSLFVSFDAVMEQIPDYHKDVKEKGAAHGFKVWEMPARVVGYELLRRAIEKKANILLEHSGVNDAHLELMKNAKKLGYKTEVNFIMCEKEEAYRRVLKREKEEKRHTPRKLVDDRAKLMEYYIDKYKNIADNTVIFDSTTHKFVKKS
jgi:probable phosphoglycerate mutase